MTTICYFILFVLFSSALLIELNLAKMIRNGHPYASEQLYINSYIRGNSKPNTLCDLPNEKKLAICNAILNEIILIRNYPNYLNKLAVSNESLDCEKHTLTFIKDPKSDTEYEQMMFPCFARHDPVRTAWNIDEYYKYLRLSGGPEYGSVFLYYCRTRPTGETYELFDLITNVDVDALPSVTITREDLDYELKSLERVSYNDRIDQIETLYIRNVVMQNSNISDSVCDLDAETKLALCKVIIERDRYKHDYKIILDELAFRDSSTDCVEERVAFSWESEYNGKNVKQKMYPCHGKGDPTDVIRVSGGFRENSILVYHKFELPDIYYFNLFIENLKVENIVSAVTVDANVSRGVQETLK